MRADARADVRSEECGARSSEEQRGAARSSEEQQGAVRSSEEQADAGADARADAGPMPGLIARLARLASLVVVPPGVFQHLHSCESALESAVQIPQRCVT